MLRVCRDELLAEPSGMLGEHLRGQPTLAHELVVAVRCVRSQHEVASPPDRIAEGVVGKLMELGRLVGDRVHDAAACRDVRGRHGAEAGHERL